METTVETTVENKEVEIFYNRTEAEKSLSNYRNAQAEHLLLTGNLETEVATLQTKFSPRLEELKAKMQKEEDYMKAFCDIIGSEKSTFDSLGEFGYRKTPLAIEIKDGLTDEDVIEMLEDFLVKKHANKVENVTKKLDKNYLKKLLGMKILEKETFDKCGLVIRDSSTKFYVKPYEAKS